MTVTLYVARPALVGSTACVAGRLWPLAASGVWLTFMDGRLQHVARWVH